MVPLTLALGASVAWGASDYLGGLASRTLAVVVVLFGAQVVGLGAAGESGSAGAVLAGRLASVSVLGLAMLTRRTGVGEARKNWRILGALGGLDVLADLAYAGAAAQGEQAVVAVLASLYPLTTVLLARALLGERLGAARCFGIGLVLCGIGALSAAAAGGA